MDDDSITLDFLTEFLGVDHEHFGLLTACNGREALEILAREDVFLVVSDIKMPEITGLHLLSEIRTHYPHIEVILMTAYVSPEIRDEAQQSGCLHFLEKPFEPENLRKLILDQVTGKDDGFAGTLKNIQLSDLIQMCCLSSISMAIRVSMSSMKGTLYIQDGEITHAVCEGSKGEDAFYKILGWESGSFETLGELSVPEVTIEKNWQFLLMEAARIADEHAIETDDQDMGIGETGILTEEIQPQHERDELRVLIVDDSAMMCRILKDILSADKDIVVVGTAKNGEEALEKIHELKPDLITLDVNMPVMDGSTALKHIMIKSPCPVVIISSLAGGAQGNVLDFLRLGAVEFISKPAKNENMEAQQQQLIETVKLAAKARVNNFKRAKAPNIVHDKGAEKTDQGSCELLVVCNSGAGGYAELIKVIPLLPRELKACLVVLQDMPHEFISPLSDYLDKRSNVVVQPLQGDVQLCGGRCYIGINDLHLSMNSKEDGYSLSLGKDKPDQDRGDKTFDYFLYSIAETFSGRILVVLLSGAVVGELDGLRKIKEKKGRIIAQQLDSCMVPYPIERAIDAQLVEMEANPTEIARQISDCSK